MGAIEVGENTTGKVTRLAAFGAFVDIGKGVEGLIHISELSHQRIKSAKDAVKEGEEVTVRVLSVDPTTRRIALSLKQAQGEDTFARKKLHLIDFSQKVYTIYLVVFRRPYWHLHRVSSPPCYRWW